MDILSLEIFTRTAEEGNITKTAQLMNLSQPTVSRRIRELEEELGRQLFVRTNKSVALTDEGRQFLESASDMLTIYKKTIRQSVNNDALTGDIYIGSGEIPAFASLSKQITDFCRLHPGICFHILSGNADEISDGIEKGVIDLGLVSRSVNTESYESLEYSGKTKWGILIPHGHPLASRKQVRTDDLKGYSLILPDNPVYHRELIGRFSEPPVIAATYTLAHNAIQLVKQGLGPMLCFEDPALAAPGLVFVPLVPYRWATPLLIWKRRSAQSDVIKAFLKFIMDSL